MMNLIPILEEPSALAKHGVLAEKKNASVGSQGLFSNLLEQLQKPEKANKNIEQQGTPSKFQISTTKNSRIQASGIQTATIQTKATLLESDLNMAKKELAASAVIKTNVQTQLKVADVTVSNVKTSSPNMVKSDVNIQGALAELGKASAAALTSKNHGDGEAEEVEQFPVVGLGLAPNVSSQPLQADPEKSLSNSPRVDVLLSQEQAQQKNQQPTTSFTLQNQLESNLKSDHIPQLSSKQGEEKAQQHIEAALTNLGGQKATTKEAEQPSDTIKLTATNMGSSLIKGSSVLEGRKQSLENSILLENQPDTNFQPPLAGQAPSKRQSGVVTGKVEAALTSLGEQKATTKEAEQPADIAKVATTNMDSRLIKVSNTSVTGKQLPEKVEAGMINSGGKQQSPNQAAPLIVQGAALSAEREGTVSMDKQSTTKAVAIQQAKVVVEGGELQENNRNPQSAIAHLQQAAPVPSNQQGSPAVAQSLVGSAATRMVEHASPAGGQQDFSSSHQNVDVLMMESNKGDSKAAKGLDFQAQLAYKSQRSFTPADTMLEIVRHAKSGSTTLELQLEPAHLGKIHVSLQLDAAKQIQVMFTVDQNASRQALEQQMPQLRLALAQQGLDLGSFSMQMNQQNQGEQQGSSSHRQQDTGNTMQQEHIQHEDVIRTGVNLATDGHLSILA